MKALLFIVLVFAVANSYTWWDRWHNVPTTWVPSPTNATSQVSSLSGWVQNGPNNPHPSQYFDDYSQIYSQYMFWNTQDENQLIFCAPKYYPYNITHCKRNPYYIVQGSVEYCIPNYFGVDGYQALCNTDNPYYVTNQAECCYMNQYDPVPPFDRDLYSIDPYSAPLF